MPGTRRDGPFVPVVLHHPIGLKVKPYSRQIASSQICRGSLLFVRTGFVKVENDPCVRR